MAALKYIIDDKGNRLSVIVPIKEYEKLIKRIEELKDIETYDKAMRRKKEFIPLEKALMQIDKKRTTNKIPKG